MKYVVLSEDSRVVDVLVIDPKILYSDDRYVEVSDETFVGIGMVYDAASKTFGEYVDTIPEPTQLDRIEANMDYLVLLNS